MQVEENEKLMRAETGERFISKKIYRIKEEKIMNLIILYPIFVLNNEEFLFLKNLGRYFVPETQ